MTLNTAARTLVFGGTGFIGGHVARRLRDHGAPVTVFKRASTHVRGLDGIRTTEGDLDDIESIRHAAHDCELIVFSAAYYPVISRNADAQVALAQRQTENFYGAIDPASDVVFVSSISTIGQTPDGSPADETTPFDPRRLKSTYFRIKYAIEQESLRQAARRPGRTVIVMPSAVLGEWDVKPTTSRVVVDVARGQVPFKLRGQINVADVRDIVSGIIAALERGRSGERYVLGGENTTIESMVVTICEVAGRKPPRLPIPFGVVRALAEVSEWIHGVSGQQGPPLIPVVGVDLMQNSTHVSSAKAERELGYAHGSVRSAIERAYDWFVQHGYLRSISRCAAVPTAR
jgi:dihydroflavonol-4-reductase